MASPGELSAFLGGALSGNRSALRSLVEGLSPVVHARAMRILSRHRGGAERDRRQELLDMVQDVFVALLENNGRVLRAWQQERGLSLENFVGLVAERHVISVLRTGKRSPWTDHPTEDEELAGHFDEAINGEVNFASREMLLAVLDRLRMELSPRMLRIFYALWVEEMEVPKLCAELGMQAESVYTARSRIAKLARAIAMELSAFPESSRIPKGPHGRR